MSQPRTMVPAPVRFPTVEQGNQFYPLPPDYPDLMGRGQCQARLNALCLQETPDDVVNAWCLLKRYYLESLAPGFWYKPPWFPSPRCHYQAVWDKANWPYNLIVFPRSYGKSTLTREWDLLMLLTRPYYRIFAIKSRDSFVHKHIGAVKGQIERNDRLRDDFGDLKPKRGGGAWASRWIQLTNGSELEGSSITGQMLGPRPNEWTCDDVEFDPAMIISPQLLTEQFRYLLHNHLMPQLDEGCLATIWGTLMTRKAWIYQAATATEAEEPRMAVWNRTVVAAKEDGQLTWAEKFSEERLQSMKERDGATAFAAQQMNEPGSEQERSLPLHPRLSYYVVEQPDDDLAYRPLSTNAELISWLHDGTSDETGKILTREVRRPYGDVASRMFRYALVDPCKKPGAQSDFACIMVVGLERSELYRDTLWLLDLWLGREKTSSVIARSWDISLKWKVRAIGIESVGGQIEIAERLEADFRNRAETEGWMPRVQPITYKSDIKLPKGTRILGALAWRFEQFRVKVPRHLALEKPWSDLIWQIENFTEDLRLLPHDDAIDTLAMFQYLVRPRGRYGLREPDQAQDVMSLLSKGEQFFPGTKVRLLDSVNASELTPEAREGVAKRRRFPRRTTRVRGPKRSFSNVT